MLQTSLNTHALMHLSLLHDVIQKNPQKWFQYCAKCPCVVGLWIGLTCQTGPFICQSHPCIVSVPAHMTAMPIISTLVQQSPLAVVRTAIALNFQKWKTRKQKQRTCTNVTIENHCSKVECDITIDTQSSQLFVIFMCVFVTNAFMTRYIIAYGDTPLLCYQMIQLTKDNQQQKHISE